VGAPCVLEIEFLLSPQKRREFVQSLEFFLASSDSGPNQIRLLQDRAEPDHLMWISKGLDLKELEDFTQMDQFRALMGGLRLLTTILDCRIVALDGSPKCRHSTGDRDIFPPRRESSKQRDPRPARHDIP
jgi:hypothetical protein